MTVFGSFALRHCAFLAAAMLLVAAGPAWPQAATPQPQPSPGVQGQPPAQSVPAQPAPAAPVPQASPENPGLINEMGKLIDKITPSIKSPGQTLDDLHAGAKDAGEALSRIAKPGSMVSSRTICPPGADRTPDCNAAANWLCQNKGYKEGKSLNTDAAENCSAKVLIPGRQRKPDDCHTNTYVTTALCQ